MKKLKYGQLRKQIKEVSIILTYRNRDLLIVEKCLNSFKAQTKLNFIVYIVDYGSNSYYSEKLESLLVNYEFCELIKVPVSFQLWNKSKAINIALKICNEPYFFVGDIDIIFREDFIEKLNEVKNEAEVTYFQVGFLSKEESKKELPFINYKIKHISGAEATGMTLYPTVLLKSINGYDEFYHGWGSEDSDVHERLKSFNIKVNFYIKETILLHQWHSRVYRLKESLEPFHSGLEKINSKYFLQGVKSKKVKANVEFKWGVLQKKDNFKPHNIFQITNEESEIQAFLEGSFFNFKNQNLIVRVTISKEYRSLKNTFKKLLGKKYKVFYSLQKVNDLLLMTLISNYRTNYYEYCWEKKDNVIELKITL